MTEPIGDPPPAAEAKEDGPTSLEIYIRENRGRFTEDVLRNGALAAGHPLEAVNAALASTRGDPSVVDRGPIARKVFIWYLAVYLILDALMLINPANNRGEGFLGDVRGIGIVILSMSLGAAFVASLIWIASRRLFVALIGAGIAISGVQTLMSLIAAMGYRDPDYSVPPTAFLLPIVLVGVGVGVVVAAFRVGRTGAPASPSTQLLMIVPVLLLLAIGGTCVVSGLPIPRPV